MWYFLNLICNWPYSWVQECSLADYPREFPKVKVRVHLVTPMSLHLLFKPQNYQCLNCVIRNSSIESIASFYGTNETPIQICLFDPSEWYFLHSKFWLFSTDNFVDISEPQVFHPERKDPYLNFPIYIFSLNGENIFPYWNQNKQMENWTYYHISSKLLEGPK